MVEIIIYINKEELIIKEKKINNLYKRIIYLIYLEDILNIVCNKITDILLIIILTIVSSRNKILFLNINFI